MRITNSMLVTGFLGDMNRNLNAMNKVMKQLDTGKVFSRPSDDPFRVSRSMQMYTEIDANKQYNNNIKDTINWMDTTGEAMTHGTNCLQRIRELMVSAGNAAYGTSELKAIQDEINEKVAEFGQILNTSFDGKYIFAGTDSTVRPIEVKRSVTSQPQGTTTAQLGAVNTNYEGEGTTLTVVFDGVNKKFDITKGDGTVQSVTVDDLHGMGDKLNVDGIELDFNAIMADPSVVDGNSWKVTVDPKKNSIGINGNEDNIGNKLQVEISSGVVVDYNITANEILKFKDKDGNEIDVSKVFDDILNNLSDPDTKDKVVSENLEQIDQIINNMLSLNSKVGTIQNRMESAKEINETQNFNLTEILSGNEDIDWVEKSMELAVVQTVYMASLQTSTKILQPTIMDFLR